MIIYFNINVIVTNGDVTYEVYVDGPYGSPSSSVCRVPHAVLVCAGIGVTPFAALLQSIVHRRVIDEFLASHRSSFAALLQCIVHRRVIDELLASHRSSFAALLQSIVHRRVIDELLASHRSSFAALLQSIVHRRVIDELLGSYRLSYFLLVLIYRVTFCNDLNIRNFNFYLLPPYTQSNHRVGSFRGNHREQKFCIQ